MCRAGLLVAMVFSSVSATAHEACPVRTEKLRFDEELGCYREAEDLEGLDTLKAIPVGDDDWLAFGGEIRQRHEYTNNPAFSAGTQDDDGVWLQRFSLHGDLQIGEHVRFFGQLNSALERGRAGGPSPVDQNDLTVQNAFVDLSAPLSADADATLRLGRQELDFGAGRLVDVREGPNVRRTFDAVRGFVTAGNWRIDGVIARPRLSEPGIFDDRTDRDQALWGLYATGGQGVLPLGAVDLYYIGYRNEGAVFAQGGGDERRHSIGARLWGVQRNWDWNWEAVYQFGSFGDGDIQAWTVASITGYTFESVPWRPRVALSANIASGDNDPDDSDLGTFNALFPRGNYFSQAAVLGPQNFCNLHAFLTVRPGEHLAFTTDYNLFWRLDSNDGVYNLGGQLLAPRGGHERFVGSAVSLTAEYYLTHRIHVTAIYTHFAAGDVFNAAGRSEDIDFVELSARFRF